MLFNNIISQYLSRKTSKTRKPCHLVMTLLTRNNDDVLKHNIEFHLSQGVDFFIVMDNLSTDSSKEILLKYEKLGVLHYIYQPSKVFNQAKWVTEMARMAKTRFGADWIINNDVDEFWWPTEQGKTLKDVFQSLAKSTNVLICKRYNFIHTQFSKPHDNFLETMIYKDCHSTNTVNEPLPPKIAHKASRFIKIGAGNHSVSGIGKQRSHAGHINVLHFPFRNHQQIIDRIRIGGQALKNSDLQKNTYTTWRKLYEELQTTEDVDDFLTHYSYNKEQLKEGLDSERLIKDTQLRDYFKNLKMKVKD